MAARKWSHYHTWAHINPVYHEGSRFIANIQPRSYMIQHTCHMLHKVHKYIAIYQGTITVSTTQVLNTVVVAEAK